MTIKSTLVLFFLSLLSLVSISFLNVAEASTNLVVGGSFPPTSSFQDNWTIVGDVRMDDIQGGAPALRGNDANSEYGYSAQPAGKISQEINTTPCEEYTLSYEVFGAYPYCKENNEGTTVASVYVNITDDDGVLLESGHASADLGTSTTTKTVNKSLVFTATSTTTKIEFGKGTYEGAPFTTTPCFWTFVDNVSVMQKNTTSVVSTSQPNTIPSTTIPTQVSGLILNGNFDTSASWQRQGDAAYVDGKIQIIYGNYRKHSGSVSQAITTNPGQAYTVSYETAFFSKEGTDPSYDFTQETVRYDLNFKAQSNGSIIDSKNHSKTLSGRGNNIIQKHTASFTANSSQTVLVFEGSIQNITPGYLTGEDVGDLIIDLDNVSVVAGTIGTASSTIITPKTTTSDAIEKPTQVITETINTNAKSSPTTSETQIQTEEMDKVSIFNSDTEEIVVPEINLKTEIRQESFIVKIKNFFKHLFSKK